MIRGASLLQDGNSTSSPEVDELRAELIKQKILFEAELRRQREVSDERFLAVHRQLQAVLDDNTQLRRTLHGLGERLALVEQRGRSASPAPPPLVHQNVSAVNADGSAVVNNKDPNSRQSSAGVGSAKQQQQYRRYGSGVGSRQASPVPRSSAPQPTVGGGTAASGGGGVHGGIHNSSAVSQHPTHFVKIRSSPSTTPRTTPRAPITRTASAHSIGNDSARRSAIGITSPAHVPFRPVLRSNIQPFRSPLRQAQLQQIGKPSLTSGHWR